ncbi:MAG: peptide-methionine (S)-S-oxide reductase MsrA [Bacteroidota bacterium]
METITLGGGCFWCTEAIFKDVKGVHAVVSGYANGHKVNPTYKEVCSGNTGHNEVIQVQFDPAIVSLKDILEIFFVTHDPTTLNRQGNDIGTQYRSGIYFESEEQKAVAEAAKVAAQDLYPSAIVTEVVPLTSYYPAEDYHQDYFANNPNQPYCNFVINPKVSKFRQKYAARLK